MKKMSLCAISNIECCNCTECCEYRSTESNVRYAEEHERRSDANPKNEKTEVSESSGVRPVIGSVLNEAVETINGKRLNVYGMPENSFAFIGMFWEIVDMADPEMPDESRTALKMALMKIARILQKPKDRDSWRDAAGYLGIGCDLALAEDIEKEHHDAQ